MWELEKTNLPGLAPKMPRSYLAREMGQKPAKETLTICPYRGGNRRKKGFKILRCRENRAEASLSFLEMDKKVPARDNWYMVLMAGRLVKKM